jgi:uncharacterized protein (TIGR02594 family)
MVKPPWLEYAIRELGTAEIPGPRNNPKIVEYHDATELSANDDETSWCSSFINWCMAQAGIQGTGSAAARSWLDWGREPATDEEYFGCVCVLWRGWPEGWQGHVGILCDWTDDSVQILGGNQNNQVSRAWFPVGRVLGYRTPAYEKA